MKSSHGWVDQSREDELIDLWPEHAERMIGAKEYYDRNHKAIVLYLENADPLSIELDLVTYFSWKANPIFTGSVWLQEVFRKGNLHIGQEWS